MAPIGRHVCRHAYRPVYRHVCVGMPIGLRMDMCARHKWVREALVVSRAVKRSSAAVRSAGSPVSKTHFRYR